MRNRLFMIKSYQDAQNLSMLFFNSSVSAFARKKRTAVWIAIVLSVNDIVSMILFVNDVRRGVRPTAFRPVLLYSASHKNYHSSHPYDLLRNRSALRVHAAPSGYSHPHHKYPQRRRNRRNNHRRDRNRSKSDHHGCAVRQSRSPQPCKVHIPDQPELLFVHDAHAQIQALPSILPPAVPQNHMPIFFSSTSLVHLHELIPLFYIAIGEMSREHLSGKSKISFTLQRTLR